MKTHGCMSAERSDRERIDPGLLNSPWYKSVYSIDLTRETRTSRDDKRRMRSRRAHWRSTTRSHDARELEEVGRDERGEQARGTTKAGGRTHDRDTLGGPFKYTVADRAEVRSGVSGQRRQARQAHREVGARRSTSQR